MSLGGMTSICLAAQAPELVRKLVLVDVTPGVTAEKAKAITDFVNGPATFPDFDAILARTVEHNPTRTVSSLRRGILHNAVQLPDGSWVWRHRRHSRTPAEAEAKQAEQAENRPDYGILWDRLAAISVPVLLVRGMRKQSVVDDGDEEEFVRRVRRPTVARVQEAGHSVQGDDPLELTRLVNAFVFG
jgi:pimeloyl-ACP methyl ester carboxylesterase